MPRARLTKLQLLYQPTPRSREQMNQGGVEAGNCHVWKRAKVEISLSPIKQGYRIFSICWIRAYFCMVGVMLLCFSCTVRNGNVNAS